MFDRVISTIAFRSLFFFGYQREQNYTEIVLKHVFLIKCLHFAKYLIEIAGKAVYKKETSHPLKFLEPA